MCSVSLTHHTLHHDSYPLFRHFKIQHKWFVIQQLTLTIAFQGSLYYIFNQHQPSFLSTSLTNLQRPLTYLIIAKIKNFQSSIQNEFYVLFGLEHLATGC